MSEGTNVGTVLIGAAGIVRILNRALELDHVAVSKLFEFRVPCNQDIVNDDQIVALEDPPGTFSLGFLGLLNGAYHHGSLGKNFIKAVYNDNGRLEKFVTTDD